MTTIRPTDPPHPRVIFITAVRGVAVGFFKSVSSTRRGQIDENRLPRRGQKYVIRYACTEKDEKRVFYLFLIEILKRVIIIIAIIIFI